MENAEKCARFLRTSKTTSDYENQVAEVDAHIEARGYDVARTFILDGESAYKGEHEPELEELVNDIRAGKYTVVVVVHSSRLDRREHDQAMMTHLAIRVAGGRIESVREPEFGRSDLAGRVMSLLAIEANHKYSRDLSGHIKAGHARGRANGAFVSGSVPAGYKVAGERYHRRLVPDPKVAPIIAEVFARIIRGHSLGNVAAWATKELGKNVWAGTVQDWISNPVYKGFLCQRIENGGKHTWGRVLHECEGLVTLAEWNAAQAEMIARRRKPGIRKGSQMLTGVLFCQCGAARMYRIQSGGDRRFYYYCKRTPLGGGCGNMVLKDVTDRLAGQLVSKMTTKLVKPVLVPGVNHEAEINAIMMEIQGLNIRDKAERARRNELEDEIDRLEELEVIPDRIDMIESDETIGDEFALVPEADRNTWLKEKRITFTAQNAKKFPKSPVWSPEPGMTRSRAREGNTIVTCVYSPGSAMK